MQKDKNIHVAYFAFRWLTVILTQEFALPDVIRLWDSVLADLALDISENQEFVKKERRRSSPLSSSSPTKTNINGLVVDLTMGRDGKFDFLIDLCCSMLM